MATAQAGSTSASAQIASNSDLPKGFKSVVAAFSSFKNKKNSSDLIIKCNSEQWFAHSLILCPQSSYFTHACNGGFKEAKEGTFILDNFHYYQIQAVLDFVYDQDYNDEPTKPDIHPLTFNVWVLTIADYLDIPALEELATKKFCERAKTDWNTIGFGQAVRELWTNSPDKSLAMRKCAIEVANQHAQELMADDVYGVEFRSQPLPYRVQYGGVRGPAQGTQGGSRRR